MAGICGHGWFVSTFVSILGRAVLPCLVRECRGVWRHLQQACDVGALVSLMCGLASRPVDNPKSCLGPQKAFVYVSSIYWY